MSTHKHRLKFLLICLFLLPTLIGGWFWLRHERQYSVLTSIQESGGEVKYREFDVESYWSMTKNRKALHTLQVADKSFSDQSMARLYDLDHLHVLNLSGTSLTDKGLASIRKLPELSVLDLSRTAITNRGLGYLTDLPNLKYLFLSGTQVSDHGMSDLSKLDNLALIDLSNTSITDMGVSQLANLRNLNMLYLSGTNVTDKCLQHMQRHQSLARLTLDNTQINGTGLKELTGLQKMLQLSLRRTRLDFTHPNLLRPLNIPLLDISYTSLDNEQLKHLVQTGDLNIPHLRIDGVDIDETGLKEISKLNRVYSLSIRDITVNHVGLKHLAQMNNLHELMLDIDLITDTEFEVLRSFPKLRSLRLSQQDREVSDDEVVQFRKELPQLVILKSTLDPRQAVRVYLGLDART